MAENKGYQGRWAENVDAIEMKTMIMEGRGMSGKYKVREKTRGSRSSVKQYWTKKQSDSLRARGNQGKLAL